MRWFRIELDNGIQHGELSQTEMYSVLIQLNVTEVRSILTHSRKSLCYFKKEEMFGRNISYPSQLLVTVICVCFNMPPALASLCHPPVLMLVT